MDSPNQYTQIQKVIKQLHFKHTYIHTCIHTYMHACIHTYIHTSIHACIHTYTHREFAPPPTSPGFVSGGIGAQRQAKQVHASRRGARKTREQSKSYQFGLEEFPRRDGTVGVECSCRGPTTVWSFGTWSAGP